MSAPPVTRLHVTAAEELQIRNAVRGADVRLLGPDYKIAQEADADALLDLLSDSQVSDPIYDLPRPFTRENIRQWIIDARRRQLRGEAVLAVLVDEAGGILSYSYFSVWPDRSAAEIGGAFRADAQSQGTGKAGAARSFGWMFDHLGVRLIGLTAALDNLRSARVIEAAGFRYMGERDSIRPDGTARRSRYWELTRDEWLRMQPGSIGG
ncbi:MAG: GNAT family protein [Erythrobacter sp.]|nr:GNAT family protein [Erythrobacter sp.]MDZ4273768.1 GNAT family protein [Erythrobacter sp.]